METSQSGLRCVLRKPTIHSAISAISLSPRIDPQLLNDYSHSTDEETKAQGVPGLPPRSHSWKGPGQGLEPQRSRLQGPGSRPAHAHSLPAQLGEECSPGQHLGAPVQPGCQTVLAGGEGMLREGPGLRPGGIVAQAGHSPCSGGSHVVSVHLLVLQKPRLLWDCKRTSGQNEKGDMDQKLRTKKGQWLGGHRRAM